MLQIGAELLAKKRTALLAASESKEQGVISEDNVDVSGRDLLTLLIKANIAKDLPESQRLSDDEVIAREYTTLSVIISIQLNLIWLCRNPNVSPNSR